MEKVTEQLLALRNRMVHLIKEVDSVIDSIGIENEKLNMNQHIESIIELTAQHFNVNVKLIKSSSKRPFPDCRKMITKICHEYGYSYKTIGDSLGGRDHSTMITSINSHNDLMQTNERYRSNFNGLLESLDYKTEVKKAS